MEKIRVGIVGTGYTVGLQAIMRKATYRIQAVSSLLSTTLSRDVPHSGQRKKIWRWKSVLTTMSCLRR